MGDDIGAASAAQERLLRNRGGRRVEPTSSVSGGLQLGTRRNCVEAREESPWGCAAVNSTIADG
jgi:hypothetical protein